MTNCSAEQFKAARFFHRKKFVVSNEFDEKKIKRAAEDNDH